MITEKQKWQKTLKNFFYYGPVSLYPLLEEALQALAWRSMFSVWQGSAASTALIALLAFLPNLLLGVPAGVLADRIDRRLLMMLGDGLSAIGLNLLKIYHFITMHMFVCMVKQQKNQH